MKQLQLLAFKDVIPILEKETVFYTCWPEKWIDLLRKSNERWKLKTKLTGLTERLFIIFSDILFIQNDVQSLDGKKPWIVTKQPLPQDQFEYVCKAWLQVIDEGHESSIIDIAEEIKWHKGEVNDVFKEDDNAKYRWVPALVADQLCERPLHLSISQNITSNITFYRIQSGKVFEAMSEPLKREDKQDYYSYVYRFELITRGIENKPLLKVSFGIRRFYQKKTKKQANLIRNNQKVTVYVSIQNPFLNVKKRSFAKLKIEQENFKVKWEQNSFALLDDLIIGGLPDLTEIMKNPKAYIEDEKVKIFIVYNENTFSIPGTKVQRGIGLPEKEELLRAFLKRFPDFKLIPLCKEVKTSFNDHVLPLYAPDGLKELCLEVYSNGMTAKVEEVLMKKNLAKEAKDDHCFVLNTEPEIVLNIVERSPEGIVQDLDYERYKEKAASRHVQSLVQKVGNSEQEILSLVEIDAYENNNIDPKQAIREGLARRGRISQFIYPLEYDNAGGERIYNALLDLFADKGFRKQNWSKFHFNGIILSVTLVKINRKRKAEYLPVLTKIQGEVIEYKVYGDEKWKPIDDSILSVNNHKLFLQNKESEKLKQFIVNELLHTLNETEERVCLIVDAKLRHGWLQELTNPKMKVNEISQFDDVLTVFQNLRVIRINQTSDVPQFFIDENDSYINKKSGLYRDPVEIYYSVGLRPSTMKGISNHIKKIDAPTKMIFQQRAVEIIVSGADETERDELACMIDYLRRMVVTFEKHTQLPLPMHMVRSIKKYLSKEETYVAQDELEDDIIVEEDGQLAVDFD